MIVGEHEAEFLDGPGKGTTQRIPKNRDIVEVVTVDLRTREKTIVRYVPVKITYAVGSVKRIADAIPDFSEGEPEE